MRVVIKSGFCCCQRRSTQTFQHARIDSRRPRHPISGNHEKALRLALCGRCSAGVTRIPVQGEPVALRTGLGSARLRFIHLSCGDQRERCIHVEPWRVGAAFSLSGASRSSTWRCLHERALFPASKSPVLCGVREADLLRARHFLQFHRRDSTGPPRSNGGTRRVRQAQSGAFACLRSRRRGAAPRQTLEPRWSVVAVHLPPLRLHDSAPAED